MFAGALSACHSVQGSPFYFETGTQSLLWLNTFEKKKISSLKNIETFFTLNENVIIKNNGRWENDPEREKRIALTQKIWNNRNSIASIYRFLEAFNDTPGVPFEISNKYVKARLYEDKKAEITIGGEKFTRKDWPDFAKYLSGGWFEEFTYLQLRPLLDKGVITDLRIGFEVVWKNDPESLAQELDVVAANGNQMMIIECKAGGLKSEYIHKLQNNIANYGGVNGLGALVCASQRLPGHVKSRIEAQSHIGLFMNEAVVKTLPRQVFNLTGSGIYLT
jgi:hypothetical protein